MTRPELKGNNKYNCPDGYLPCIPKLIEEQGDSLEYVQCYKEGEQDETCPITDIRFRQDDFRDQATYSERKFTKADGSEFSMWLSYDHAQHGIEQMKVAPMPPCLGD